MKYVVWLAIVCVVALYIVGPIQDPDLWWHIVVGRWIVSHGQVPHQDYWTLFSAGQPWRAYSWSSEVLFAWTERLGGIHGLLALKMLVAIVLCGTLCAVMARISSHPFMGMVLGVYATVACFNHFTLRPQALVWIVFGTLFGIVDDIERNGASPRRLLKLAAMMMLWANLHLSAALGIVTAVLWVISDARDWSERFSRGSPVLVAGFVGTLVTPYLGGEWITFFDTSSHPARFQSVAEFQPATILQYSTGFLAVACFFLGALIYRRPSLLGFSRFLLWIGFSLGALTVVKFLPFAVIVSTALIARLWREKTLHTEASALIEGISQLAALVRKVPAEGASFVLICVSIVQAYQLWHEPLAYEVTPVEAVDFIEKHKLPHPILNTFGNGGYLMYRQADADGNPQVRVNIDGRTNLIDQAMWRKYISAWDGKRSWSEYLDLVKPETVLWRADSALPALLLATGDWCVVFESGSKRQRERGTTTVVLTKRGFVEEHPDAQVNADCDRGIPKADFKPLSNDGSR